MGRNLLAEAQAIGAAQTAPQVAALQNALTQARSDRNSAIHAAATAYQGLSGAIHRAGPQVRRNFADAAHMTASTDSIASQGVGGSPVISAAYAREGAVGGGIVAKALASRLSDLSDRRIAAAAGRAFSVTRANSDFSAAAATNADKLQQVAAQQGAYTAAAASKLNESASNRAVARSRIRSSERIAGARIQSSESIAAANRSSRESIAGATLSSREHTAALGRRQQKLGRIDRAKLQTQRLDAQGAKTGNGPKPSASHVYAGRASILAWKQAYDGKPHDMASVAAEARGKNVPETIIRAAANLSSKGYIAPREVHELSQLGVTVPKEWTPQVVRAHARKRPQVFKP